MRFSGQTLEQRFYGQCRPFAAINLAKLGSFNLSESNQLEFI